MRAWGRLVFAAAAVLLLPGCLWSPGKFTSELALRKGGAFVLDYRGEILFQLPDDKDRQPEPWSDSMAVCRVGRPPELGLGGDVPIRVPEGVELPKKRECTAAEIANLKARYRKQAAEQAAKKSAEVDQMAKMLGLPGADDESNRRFAANLMKYRGWRSVRYRGKGVFDVEYHFEGRTDQAFAFPMMPDSDLLIPFVAIRRRNDGSVQVTAPGLTGAAGGPLGARALAMGMPKSEQGPPSRAEGRFIVTTDGDILTNNSEDGPAASASGKQLRWDVGAGSKRVPEMLVRL